MECYCVARNKPIRREITKPQTATVIDLFTDTAAILNELGLRSIIGCPGGMSTFRFYFRALFGTFFHVLRIRL